MEPDLEVLSWSLEVSHGSGAVGRGVWKTEGRTLGNWVSMEEVGKEPY